MLKMKIEELREELNQAIADEMPADVIYEKSVELDRLIEQYLDIVSWEKVNTKYEIAWKIQYFPGNFFCLYCTNHLHLSGKEGSIYIKVVESG